MSAVARRSGRARGLGHVRPERETVLILGTAQRAAQATARSLTRAGFRVVGAWEGGRLAGRTRYCEQLYGIPPASATEAFLTAVREMRERESVRAIVPLSDELQAALLTNPGAAAPAVVLGPSLEEFRDPLPTLAAVSAIVRVPRSVSAARACVFSVPRAVT